MGYEKYIYQTYGESEGSIRLIMNMGYIREEVINILNGKNPDGNEFKQLPF